MKKLLTVSAVLFFLLSACQQGKQQSKPLPADKVTEIRFTLNIISKR